VGDPQRDLVGPYTGEVAGWWKGSLGHFSELLRDAPEHGRSGVRRIELDGQAVAVKSFAAGSHRARRSYEVARALEESGVGTPRPLAFLDGKEASHYLSLWIDDTSSFNRQLLHLLHHEFQYDKILNLMDVVAAAVRKMHDAGVRHGDMGNQNILCRRKGPYEWGDVAFLDLERGRVRELSMRDRAFDCSRLTLPSRLLKNFLSMYWRDRYRAGKRPPEAFQTHLRRYKRRFALHSKTRKWRHPFRERKTKDKPRYPAPKDYWVWDERTHQAIGVLMKRDRLPLMPVWPTVKTGLIAAAKFLPARARFGRLREECFTRRVPMDGGIGMTLTPSPGTWELEKQYLARLERKLPVLLRFYHHDDADARAFTCRVARELHGEGYEVAGAMVQSRKAVTDPASWRALLDEVFGEVGDVLGEVEIGHAINRVKWGLWSVDEYVALLEPWRDLERRYPHVKLLGPAVNDFEFQYLASALAQVPRDVELDATSLHLYVDRRGAPENEQRVMGGRYDAVDKFAWARALGGEVVVTEVNWPLKDPGGYMPEFNPYFWKGNPSLDTTVTEEQQAWYLVRYVLLALCSGMVRRVYWWHLASPLFGIVDTTADGWRARPAHKALRDLLAWVDGAVFTGKDDGRYVLHFEKDGERFSIGWTVAGEREERGGLLLTPAPALLPEG